MVINVPFHLFTIFSTKCTTFFLELHFTPLFIAIFIYGSPIMNKTLISCNFCVFWKLAKRHLLMCVDVYMCSHQFFLSSLLLCNYSTSECTESCQQTLTWDWLHAFMDAAQPLYHSYVSVLYIGQDQAYNVFTGDYNSCFHSGESLTYSLLDKNRWNLSLPGLSPIRHVFCVLLASPLCVCGIFLCRDLSIYLCIVSITRLFQWTTWL